ncbi:MAG: nuclear transport factor 2 family protein [Balneolaceae bacterium]
MTEKAKFLKKINDAFAKSDIEFILQNVTDDIRWTVHGDFSLQGKDDFTKAMEKMASDEPYELNIENIITHGKSAAVNGIMKMPGNDKTYAFCDIYHFNGFKNPKIKEMITYVLEQKEDK